MTDVSGVNSSSETGGTDTSSGADKSGGSSKNPANVTFSSLDELRKKDPELYNQINGLLMQGMAQDICDKSKKAQEKLKQIRLEAERR